MDEIDTIRDQCVVYVSDSIAARMSELAAEIVSLRARLAEVEAERDAALAGSREIRGTLLAAEARLAEVEAERDEHRTERHRLMKLVSVRESAWGAAEARLAEVEAERDLLRQAHERAEVHLGETQDRLAAVEGVCDRADPFRALKLIADIRAAVRGEGDRG
jgi:chromosome segregation ATPase